MTKPLQTFTSLLLFLCISTSIYAQETIKTTDNQLLSLVNRYYELNLTVFKAYSTVADIDKVFDLFTDDFTYVHPKYGGTYTRDNLYKGYLRNQKNGMYDGTIVDIIIRNQITGLNAVVVERAYLEKTDEGTQQGEPRMTLFEFKEGKIFRIFEYW